MLSRGCERARWVEGASVKKLAARGVCEEGNASMRVAREANSIEVHAQCMREREVSGIVQCEAASGCMRNVCVSMRAWGG